MENDRYIVIEGIHENPNKIDTIDQNSKKVYGPFTKTKADSFCKNLIQKNIDNFYHRAWVVIDSTKLDNICETCNKEHESVKHNLIIYSYKICNSCQISKTIFPA